MLFWSLLGKSGQTHKSKGFFRRAESMPGGSILIELVEQTKSALADLDVKLWVWKTIPVVALRLWKITSGSNDDPTFSRGACSLVRKSLSDLRIL